jgi:hypothetical protein
MQAYASHTGTRRNLSAMREASWRLILSPAGTLTTQSMKYGLDNGAWSAFQQGRPFNDLAFMRAVEKVGEGADWIVLPDIVAGGMRSLDLLDGSLTRLANSAIDCRAKWHGVGRRTPTSFAQHWDFHRWRYCLERVHCDSVGPVGAPTELLSARRPSEHGTTHCDMRCCWCE